jgi:hypothetical protein
LNLGFLEWWLWKILSFWMCHLVDWYNFITGVEK